MPCTATAPIGSSIPIPSTQITPTTAMTPETRPITIAAQGDVARGSGDRDERSDHAVQHHRQVGLLQDDPAVNDRRRDRPAAAAMFVVIAT